MLGRNCTTEAVDDNNSIVVGSGAVGHGSNTVVIGNSATLNIDPHTHDSTDLGTSALRYKSLYCSNTVDAATAITTAGTLHVTGTTTCHQL